MPDPRDEPNNVPRWRRRRLAGVVIACGAIALAAAFLDDVFVAYQTWRYGAPGIARDSSEPARSIASEFWPFAGAICADPGVSAAELNEQIPVSDYRLWNGGYDLVRRSGLIELRQRRLYGHRWDRGWRLLSITVDGNLDRVMVERPRLGPLDGPAPSTYVIYDGACRLIGASFSEVGTMSEGVWEVCLGPGWVEADCEAFQEELDRLFDVWRSPFDEEEKLCFDDTWSRIADC